MADEKPEEQAYEEAREDLDVPGEVAEDIAGGRKAGGSPPEYTPSSTSNPAPEGAVPAAS